MHFAWQAQYQRHVHQRSGASEAKHYQLIPLELQLQQHFQLQLHYSSSTTLQLQLQLQVQLQLQLQLLQLLQLQFQLFNYTTTTTTTATTTFSNFNNINCTTAATTTTTITAAITLLVATPHYILQLWVRIRSANHASQQLSYRFPIFEISATALCGTTGMEVSIVMGVTPSSHPWFLGQPHRWISCHISSQWLPQCLTSWNAVGNFFFRGYFGIPNWRISSDFRRWYHGFNEISWKGLQ